MWKSGGVQPVPGSAPASDAKARLRARLWLLLALAAVFLIVAFGFPLLFPLRIAVPSSLQFSSASSMTFEIANENLTPLTDIEYTCEISKLELSAGSPVKDANVVTRGSIRKIGGHHGAAGRCQTGYFVAAPLKTAEYRVTVTYRPYPWPRRRTRVVRISAQLNGQGELTGWNVE